MRIVCPLPDAEGHKSRGRRSAPSAVEHLPPAHTQLCLNIRVGIAHPIERACNHCAAFARGREQLVGIRYGVVTGKHPCLRVKPPAQINVIGGNRGQAERVTGLAAAAARWAGAAAGAAAAAAGAAPPTLRASLAIPASPTLRASPAIPASPILRASPAIPVSPILRASPALPYHPLRRSGYINSG